MKKVFTLLVAVGLFVAADAQRGPQRGRPVTGVQVTIGGNFNNSFAADRMLRQEIARINFKYDRRIQQVRNSFFMRPVVKQRKIRSLEIQRQREIRRAQQRFFQNGNRYGQRNRRY